MESDAAYTDQTKSQGAAAGHPAEYRVLLKNAGGSADTFLLTGTAGGSGFAVQYLDEAGTDRTAAFTGGGWVTPAIAAGGSLTVRLLVTPSLTPLTANFTAVVHAAASQEGRADEVKTETCSTGVVAAVTLTAPDDISAPPGTLVYYPYTITNAGNVENVFSLTASGAAGWGSVIIADDAPADGVHQAGETRGTASSGPLPPGGSYRFFLAVTVPPDAANGARAEIVLTANGSGTVASDRTVTAAVAPALRFAESVRNVSQGGVFGAGMEAVPGDTVEYRLSVTNSGSATATSLVVTSSLPEHTRYLPGSVKISSAPDGDAAPCAAQSCGFAAEGSGAITAYLGEGGGASSGGSLAPGQTLYLYFRVTVL